MLVRRVVRDIIQQHVDVAAVCLFDQLVGVGQCAENRIDVLVVRNVVAVVSHRRRENRTQPYRIDSKPFEVVELVDDPREVANTICVRIAEASRVDLIYDAAAPPFVTDRRLSDTGSARWCHAAGSRSYAGNAIVESSALAAWRESSRVCCTTIGRSLSITAA